MNNKIAGSNFRTKKKGEIAVTLGVLSLLVTLLGIVVGSKSSQNIKTLIGRAQQLPDCTYDSTNEIHYKDTILRGVSGFRWQNNFIGPDGKNINGNFDKIEKPSDPVHTRWFVDDLRKPEYTSYKDKIAWVELTAIPSDYRVVGSFCNATDSKDVKTCERFCQKSGNFTNCHYGMTDSSARADGLLISCGGKLTYGWDVLKYWEIPTPTPTIRPTNTPTPSPTRTPTAAPSPTPRPTSTPTVAPTRTPTAAPSPTRRPTNTPTPSPTRTPTAAPTVITQSRPTPTTKPTPTSTPLPACNRRCDYTSLNSGRGLLDGACPINYTCVDACPAGKQICPQSQHGVCRRSLCTNDITCGCVVPTTRPTSVPTRTPTPTTRPTLTVGPSPTSLPCTFESISTIKIKQNQSISIFTALNKNNNKWYTTNDLPVSENYFDKGQIITKIPSFRLPRRPSNLPRPKVTYYEGDTACVTLHYDSDIYKISETNAGPGEIITPDKICNLPLACGPKYEYGWTIEKKTTSTVPNLKVAFTGDQGLTGQQDADPDGVLELIKNEGAQALVIDGDFDYDNSPDSWGTMIKRHLPLGYPLFVSAGNHDVENPDAWENYQSIIKQYIEANKDAYCDNIDHSGVKTTCTFKGITMIFSGAGLNVEGATDNEQYFRQKLGESDSTWKLCSWHRNMTEMQLGSKVESIVGWGVYEACRQFGAIIGTAHEHSYERTKTLISMQNQIHDASCTDPKTICLGPGRTFAFVSGLGGAGERRNQTRCGSNSTISDNNNDNCNGKKGTDIWASVYANKTANNPVKTTPGALFITFNVDNDPNKARGYFKTIDGTVRDEFTILKTNTGGTVPQSTNFAENVSSPTKTPMPGSISVSAKVTNYHTEIINSIEINVCRNNSKNSCTKIQRKINVGINDSQSINEKIESIDGNTIMTGLQYEISCVLLYGNGIRRDCGNRIISPDNPMTLDISAADEEDVIDVISKTERQQSDINQDTATNTFDCASMYANYGKGHDNADANGDGVTNSLDLSLCYKWLNRSND